MGLQDRERRDDEGQAKGGDSLRDPSRDVLSEGRERPIRNERMKAAKMEEMSLDNMSCTVFKRGVCKELERDCCICTYVEGSRN